MSSWWQYIKEERKSKRKEEKVRRTIGTNSIKKGASSGDPYIS